MYLNNFFLLSCSFMKLNNWLIKTEIFGDFRVRFIFVRFHKVITCHCSWKKKLNGNKTRCMGLKERFYFSQPKYKSHLVYPDTIHKISVTLRCDMILNSYSIQTYIPWPNINFLFPFSVLMQQNLFPINAKWFSFYLFFSFKVRAFKFK